MFSFAIGQQDQLVHLDHLSSVEESKYNSELNSMRIFEHNNKKPIMKNLTQHLAKIQLEMLEV